jgi:hypothetical protein
MVVRRRGSHTFPRHLYRLTDRCKVVRFEVFTAVAMKNGIFWDVAPCVSCENNSHMASHPSRSHSSAVRLFAPRKITGTHV